MKTLDDLMADLTPDELTQVHEKSRQCDLILNCINCVRRYRKHKSSRLMPWVLHSLPLRLLKGVLKI